jgi:hypothetical protein
VRSKRPAKGKPAATPDDLIATSAEGRIRVIAKRPPRRKPSNRQPHQ